MGNTRWICVDHGTARIGLAGGDSFTGIATPLEVVEAEPIESAIERVAQVAREYEAQGIVVGWPLNMDDSEGPQGKLARKLALVLAAATGLDVRMWDERLSSFTADQALAGQYTRKKKKERQDAVAAAAILQDFFNNGGPSAAPAPGDMPL